MAAGKLTVGTIWISDISVSRPGPVIHSASEEITLPRLTIHVLEDHYCNETPSGSKKPVHVWNLALANEAALEL